MGKFNGTSVNFVAHRPLCASEQVLNALTVLGKGNLTRARNLAYALLDLNRPLGDGK